MRRTRVLTVKVGQQAQFGSLTIQVQACKIHPPDQPQDSAAYSDDHRQPRGCARIPRLDAGERAVAVDAAAPDLRRARRRLPGVADAACRRCRRSRRQPCCSIWTARCWISRRRRTRWWCRRACRSAARAAAAAGRRGCGRHRPAGRNDRCAARRCSFAVAGEHGGAIRHAPGAPVERPTLPAPPGDWLAEAERLAAAASRARCWNSRRAVSRCIIAQCPPRARRCAMALTALLAGSDEFELLPAHMMWEVRPRGVDKGTAVAALMERPPFRGRLPVFLGDDVTDEDGIAAAAAMGGVGLRVQDVFGDAAGVRAWLQARSPRAGHGRATRRLQRADIRLLRHADRLGERHQTRPSRRWLCSDCHSEFHTGLSGRTRPG